MTRLAGIVLIISVLCFGVGVTRPVLRDYFRTDDFVEKRRLVQDNREQWHFANTMMDIGIMIAPIGVLIFALGQLQNSKERKSVLLAVASVISVSLAAVMWNSDYWGRFTLPMIFGIVLLGFIIRQRYSNWVGTLIIAVELVTVILLYITLQDVPPAPHFLPLLIAGITLLIFGDANEMKTSPYPPPDPRC